MDKALALCRGSYQKDLVRGYETWSGSSLAGRARDYSAHYFRSRKNLLKRIYDAGVGYLTIGDRGKIFLVFGQPPGYYTKTRVACGEAWVPGPKTVLDDILEALD